MHLKSQPERNQGDELKPRRPSLSEFKQLEAEKAKAMQQKCEDKLKVVSHKKDKDKQFLKRLEKDLYDLGKRERVARQNAKDEACKYNQLVSKEIHQRCNEAEKVTMKVWTDASRELHVAIMNKID
uniref:Uncharacterized protein n=1 Tax=Plectus sambesii TaxID=2011161 RepID=A0A914WHL0_9BILA